MRTRTRTICAGLVLAAALVGGVAWATIPSDGGVYTACKLSATGTIRLIDPSGPSTSLLGHCTTYETQITWNQRGPKGEPGPAGAVGPLGAQGAVGTNGAQGPAGDRGAQGPKGDPGEPGAAGRPGVAGTNGIDGAPGSTGAPGPKGDPCLPDTSGCQGPKGDRGEPGATGPQGPSGSVGMTGPAGPTGPTGMTGPSGATTTYTTRREKGVGREARVDCLPGEQVTGGGAYTDDETHTLTSSYPVNSDGNSANATEPAVGWAAATSLGSTYVFVFVICAS